MGLAVRFLFCAVLVPYLEARAHVGPDPDRYADLAASLVDRGELGFAPPGASPTTVRGPVFPAWLAGGMLVGGRTERWLSFWASLPGLLAALAIFLALSRTHGERAGLIGGLLCAAHPLSCFVSARLLPDELYGVLLLIGIGDTPLLSRKWTLALASSCLPLAALTRTPGVFVIPLAVVLAMMAREYRKAILVTLVSAVLLGAWAWRSSALSGRMTLVESLAGYNFWLGEAADRGGFAQGFGPARERAHALMSAEAGTEETQSPGFWYGTLPPKEASEFDRKLTAAAVRQVESSPFRYARRCAAGLFWFWVRAETAARSLQYALVALPLVALGMIGLWRSGSRLIVLTVAGHLAIYAAICPMARYSVQLYPLLSWLAGTVFVTRKPEFR